MIETEGLQARQVAAYLRRHPRFLADYPDLAQTLVVPREHGDVASLASYQIEVLRERNRELSHRLTELIALAERNERLAVRVHQQALLLMRQNSATATLAALAAHLAEEFAAERVRIVLHQQPAGLDPAPPWLRVIGPDDARLGSLGELLRKGEPFCGRLAMPQLDLLFGEDAVGLASVALLPVAQRGLIAIGSEDPGRFHPDMGTLFLRMMAAGVDAALARFDDGTSS